MLRNYLARFFLILLGWLFIARGGWAIPVGWVIDGVSNVSGGAEVSSMLMIDLRNGNALDSIFVPPNASSLYVSKKNAGHYFIATQNSVDLIGGGGIPPLASVVTGAPVMEMAVLPDESKIYTANWTNGTVTAIDAGTWQAIATIPIADLSFDVASSPDGSRIYATSMRSSDLFVINTSTDSVIDQIPVGGGAWLGQVAITPDGKKAYVTDWSGQIDVVDLESRTVLKRIPFDTANANGNNHALAICIDAAGQFAYALGYSRVDKVDLSTDTLEASIPVDFELSGMSFDISGKFLYVTDTQRITGGGSHIVKINTENFLVENKFPFAGKMLNSIAASEIFWPLPPAISGLKRGENAGFAVDFAGDFNGDGFGDLVVGAPGYQSYSGMRSGIATVISGRDGQTLAQMKNLSGRGHFGYSLAGGADINNDGYDDVVVGEPLGDGSSVSILYGPDGSNSHKIYSRSYLSLFGYSVALADMNHDDYADILVGSPADNDSVHKYPDAGSVRIFSGKDRSPMGVVYGIERNDHAGVSVSVCNMDGLGDPELVIGVQDADDHVNSIKNAGGVYVYNFNNLQDPVMKIFGSVKGDDFGRSLACGDMDHDGLDDIIVGAPYDNDLLNKLKSAGSVTVFSGKGGVPLSKKYGDSASALLGFKVAAGDVNGDGYADIIASAPKDDVSATISTKKIFNAGSVSVWSGVDYSVLGGRLYGEHVRDFFGYGLSAGDINRDGKADLIIGIPGFDASPLPPASKPIKNAGAAQVFSGTAW